MADRGRALVPVLSESERADVWSEIEQELSQFETADGFEAPCELIVSVGRAN